LAGHTLTLFRSGESESLVLIGGFSPRYGFLETVWVFDLETELWNSLNTTGNGPLGELQILKVGSLRREKKAHPVMKPYTLLLLAFFK
jgi:hypothetical protein